MPVLVDVSGTRRPLERGRDYVMGRAQDCDVVVADPAVSQHHAVLSVAAGADVVFVDDLKSRNGTFLDEARIRARTAVGDGSRIRLGSSVFLLHLKESGLEPELPDVTGTVPFDPGGLDPAVDGGELSRYGLLGLLRLLHTFKSNVTAHIALPHANARIEVREGEVHSAQFAGLDGINALIQLGRRNRGIFWIVECNAPCPRDIAATSVHLLTQLGECLESA